MNRVPALIAVGFAVALAAVSAGPSRASKPAFLYWTNYS
jgi:hypothetical protein